MILIIFVVVFIILTLYFIPTYILNKRRLNLIGKWELLIDDEKTFIKFSKPKCNYENIVFKERIESVIKRGYEVFDAQITKGDETYPSLFWFNKSYYLYYPWKTYFNGMLDIAFAKGERPGMTQIPLFINSINHANKTMNLKERSMDYFKNMNEPNGGSIKYVRLGN